MTRRKQYPRGQHPYGEAYRRERKRILAGSPMCVWCGERVATTADHEPPLYLAGPHLNLVPACAPCNYSRNNRSSRTNQRQYPPALNWGRNSREW